MPGKDLIPPTPTTEEYGVADDQGEVFTSDDPIDLFATWFSVAREKEMNDPNAMALATVDATGLPDVRIVLMKDFDRRGVSFFTNSDSAKGRQLNANPWAALCFHWKSIRRQVRFRGEIIEVSAAEADEYFAKRARGAQIGAWASQQSRPLPADGALEHAVRDLERRYKGQDVPRPSHWTGYRLVPTAIEFWVNRPFRLHDRLSFDRAGDGWTHKRLFP
ncbi:MAG: pyridoxamine 5'-phosphate oxidase [Alphaproteobacteria bacterium]|nr:pyridoxamine 5'-phosphate oxidase [Alphaproteobacteria bacterium]